MEVKFLKKDAIENYANGLLRRYIQESGPIHGAVPVEQLVMCLGLSLDYDNLSERFGVEGEILGCINMKSQEIFIEASLLPEENPSAQEGRYRFTVGHEIGHWILHRDVANRTSPQPSLKEKQATLICTASQTKPRVEWQADYFATCLLMPRFWIQKVIDQRNLRSQPSEEIIRHISGVFEVSKLATKIRLEELEVIQSVQSQAMAS